ncbi:MAG: small multi-drug export protein [Methanomicrobiaceae archaeon]|nr:small multi-drug export protein [Methanomicrobiaceae archaeon]
MNIRGDNSDTNSFQLSHTAKIILNLSAPFIFGVIFFFFIFLILPFESFERLMGLMVLNLIPPAGKESIIPLGIALGIPWYIIAASTMAMDICGALFMTLNFDLALRIPVLGRWIKGVMEGGENFFASHKYLEKLSALGLVLFVVVPFQGSGGIGGTLVGRMMGLSKIKVFISIAIGAFIGSFAIALGIEYVIDLFRFDPCIAAMALSAIMAIAAAVWFFKDRYSKRLRSGFKRNKKL